MQLTAYPFLNKLEPEALHFLKQHITPISVPKNTLLFYQGDICDNILWLTLGEVRLYSQSDSIEEITLYTLKAGEQCIVNTASLLSQTNAVASAETVTDIEGYLIDVESVKTLSKMSDAYQNYLFSLYQLRFEALTRLINDIKFKHLDTRIIEWLEKQPEKMVTITHEALSQKLSSSRVAVSRVLKALEHKGTVVLHRGKIELL